MRMPPKLYVEVLTFDIPQTAQLLAEYLEKLARQRGVRLTGPYKTDPMNMGALLCIGGGRETKRPEAGG